MLPVGPSFYQNQKLSNGLMIAGAALIITGIALACINHQVAIMLGSVCLSLGTPILLIGLIMTIVRKCQDDQRQAQTQPQTHNPTSATNRRNDTRGGQRLGSYPSDPHGTQARRNQEQRRWWQFC